MEYQIEHAMGWDATHRVDEQSLVNAATMFWREMLAMEVLRVFDREDALQNPPLARGAIQLAGAWNGEVEVLLCPGLARAATAAMLMQDAASVVESDTLDAMREIANMIAGVLKSSLPRPCTMSLPHAEIVSSANGDAPGASLEVMFAHEAGTMAVRIHVVAAPL